MNISSALRRIKALKGEIARTTGQIQMSNTWREDDVPAYNVNDIVAERTKLITELIKLKTSLAVANSTVVINGVTLTRVIHELEEIKGEIVLWEGVHTATSNDYFETENVFSGENYVTQKVQHHCTVTTRERDEKVKSLRERFASLNDLVEAANHMTEV